jgi:hypothetical protein
VAVEFARVVKDSHDVDDGFAAPAVDQEMPGPVHDAQFAASPLTTEEEMIGANALCQFRPGPRPGAFRIGGDVSKRLLL